MFSAVATPWAALRLSTSGHQSIDLRGFFGSVELTQDLSGFNRQSTVEDLLYGPLSQYQRLFQPAAPVAGGNLLSKGGTNLNLAASWSSPNASTISVLALNDATLPAALPATFRGYYEDAVVIKVVGPAGGAATLRMDMLTPSQYRIRPSDNTLWASCLILGETGSGQLWLNALMSGNLSRFNRVNQSSAWQLLTLPGIKNPTDVEMQLLEIRGTANASTIYVVAPMLSWGGFAKYSAFRNPQTVMWTSAGTRLRLAPPTAAGANAVWEAL
jgi:hypothetical protein